MITNAKLPLAVLLLAVLLTSITNVRAAEREANTDRPGLDLRAFELTAPLPAQCEQACNEDNKCHAWTFAWPGKRAGRAHCSLKSGVPPKKSDNCCISGLRSKPIVKKSPELDPETTKPEPEIRPTITEQKQPPEDLNSACDTYAKDAVAMNEENETLFCDLSGSRWGFTYDRYHSWCMTKSTPASRKSNTDARVRAIAQCRNSIGLPSKEQTEAGRNAALERTCDAYANRASDQAAQARTNSCDVSGARWLTAYQPHFSWCMTVSKAERDSETKNRNQQLAQCTASHAATLECDEYARIALTQTRDADERRCGFKGTRWRRNYGAHKNWCRTASQDDRARETRIRANALFACQVEPRIAAACSRYATSAVSSARKNRERGCGFSGRRWDLNRENHFSWCMDAKPIERRKERGQRFTAMLKCTRGTKPKASPLRTTGYQYRWRKVSLPGGKWASEWIDTSRKPVCEHLVRGCQCGAANYCGTYREGDVALWWSSGCIRRPWEIICEVRPR